MEASFPGEKRFSKLNILKQTVIKGELLLRSINSFIILHICRGRSVEGFSDSHTCTVLRNNLKLTKQLWERSS